MNEDNKKEIDEQELTAEQLENVAGGAETVHLWLKSSGSNSLLSETSLPVVGKTSHKP